VRVIFAVFNPFLIGWFNKRRPIPFGLNRGTFHIPAFVLPAISANWRLRQMVTVKIRIPCSLMPLCSRFLYAANSFRLFSSGCRRNRRQKETKESTTTRGS